MLRRRYVTLDVFTERRFAGNPLAVVLESEGLEDAAMQSIAREFNLSETVFVLPPDDPRHRAKLRIFTPGHELPFAGHPTVGAAVLLALRSETRADAQAFGLEETIGIVPCIVRTTGEESGYARFRVPQLPEAVPGAPDAAASAFALGLEPPAIGFDLHQPSRHGIGPPLLFVPVADEDALTRARPPADWARSCGDGARGVYVYARGAAGGERRFQARFFGSPELGIREDPATGSAAAAFAGVLMQFEPLGDGEHAVTVGQGYAMGRPSEIALQIVIRDGALASAEIGGAAVVVSEGEILA